jgi:hypothetical protein
MLQFVPVIVVSQEKTVVHPTVFVLNLIDSVKISFAFGNTLAPGLT